MIVVEIYTHAGPYLVRTTATNKVEALRDIRETVKAGNWVETTDGDYLVIERPEVVILYRAFDYKEMDQGAAPEPTAQKAQEDPNGNIRAYEGEYLGNTVILTGWQRRNGDGVLIYLPMTVNGRPALMDYTPERLTKIVSYVVSQATGEQCSPLIPPAPLPNMDAAREYVEDFFKWAGCAKEPTPDKITAKAGPIHARKDGVV